jgi:hypothetical protein
MELQSLMEQGMDPRDVFAIEDHNTTHPEAIEWGGWTDVWVFRVLFAPHRVRASYQEEEALRSFEQTQREGTR